MKKFLERYKTKINQLISTVLIMNILVFLLSILERAPHYTVGTLFNIVLLLCIFLIFSKILSTKEWIIKNKFQLKQDIILIFIIYLCYVLLSITTLDTETLLSNTFFLIFIFILSSFLYYATTKDISEQTLIINIYKFFFPSIILIIIGVYNFSMDVVILKDNFHRTKIEMEKNELIKNMYFNEYKTFIKDKESIFKNESIKNISLLDRITSNIEKKAQEKQTTNNVQMNQVNFFFNLVLFVIFSIINFSIIFFLQSSKIFKKEKVVRYIDRKKHS